MEPVYDCQQCGACCIDYLGRDRYVTLTSQEAERIRRLALPILDRFSRVFNETVLQLATVPYAGDGGESICVAFAGHVGGHCGCSIYEDRPSTCRAFEPGTLQCRAAREATGLPAWPRPTPAEATP
jgi:Fe-S-cluster containining protein